MLARKLKVNDEKQAAERVVTNGRITGFIVTTGINEAEERVKEDFCRSFECDAVMHENIDASLLVVPNEGSAVEFETNIHDWHYVRAYVFRQYIEMSPNAAP